MRTGEGTAVVLDDDLYDLFYADRRIRLTEQEFRFMHLLLLADGELCVHSDLIAGIGGSHTFYAGLAAIRALKNSVRRKLRREGLEGALLVEVHGVGLRLDASLGPQ